jgi:FkbH-like protein
MDYFALVKEAKALSASGGAKFKLALLGDCSTQHLAPLLKALFAREDVAVELYEAPFGAIRQETLDPASGLYAFKPDAIAILSDARALREPFSRSDEGSEAFASRASGDMIATWRAIESRSKAVILQATLPVPYERLFGNLDEKAARSLPAAVRRLNRMLVEAAGGSVRICDLDSLASYQGLGRWFDQKLWTLAKAPCSFECLPHLAKALVDATRPQRGRVVKCVVTDLDNTLWGGTIGDDGLEGIKLGHGDEGEAFLELQRFLLALKRRGILLAACSRNDEKTALEPFEKHPEMVLKCADFAAFAANWTSKAENLKAIREALNIGFDSMVFLDDDSFERNLIRAALPEVIVPELPEDAADCVKALCELNLFEAGSFTEEDRARAGRYEAQALRRSKQAAFTSPEDYLRSLNMRITVARFDAFHLPRVAQLTSRSNQFNLTTKRYAEGDCAAFMKDEAGCFPFYVTLKDDLGDSGLVAAAILLYKDDALEIDQWLMSCRVLMRGVEEHMMNAAVAHARAKGLKTVRGRYVPTAKNAMVRDFFGRFGFVKTEERPDGSADWSLDAARYEPKPVFFAEQAGAPAHG